MARPKFAFPADEIEALIELLRSQGEEVHDPELPRFPFARSRGRKFLACAKAAGVDFIVTGNKRHFRPRSCGTIRIVNAAELLDRITLEM